MFIRRTRLTAFASLAALALVVAACSDSPDPDPTNGTGSPPAGGGDPVTLEFWSMPFGGHSEDDVAAYVQEFNDSQDGIVVEFTALQWADGRDSIIQAVGAGIGPDVFIMAPVNQDFLSSGALAPLPDLGYSQDEIGQFLDIIQYAAGHEGQVYGVPVGYFANVLYYNQTILSEYGFDGPPTTWEELHDTALTITEESAAAGDPVIGFQIKGIDDHLNAINHTWANFFYAAGGTQLTDDFSAANANTDAGRQALEYLRSFVADGITTPGPSALGGFIDGTVAMFAFQQLHLPEIAASNLDDDWSLAPMPTGPVSSSAYVDGEFLVANAASEHLEEVGVFLKWMTSPEQALRYMERAPLFPYNLDAVDEDIRTAVEQIVADDPARGALLEQLTLASGENMMYERYSQAARWEAQRQYIVAAINGDIETEAALAAIDSDVNDALSAAAY